MNRRQALVVFGSMGVLLGAVPIGWMLYGTLRFPSDRTAEGAYLRIVLSLSKSKLGDCFPYLETAAQHALYTVHDFRKKSLALIRSSFEEPERSRWIEAYAAEGDARDPTAVWAYLATLRGWDVRLRRDLSGIRFVEHAGDRATVETVRGTRYAFRRAENGIWGLTLFTGELVEHKERAARDFSVIERAAQDYARAKQQAK